MYISIGRCSAYIRATALLLVQNGKEVYMTNNRVKNVGGVVGEGIHFERVRRITGYLTGDISRWNSGKAAELKDRCTHGMTRRNHEHDREER